MFFIIKVGYNSQITDWIHGVAGNFDIDSDKEKTGIDGLSHNIE